MMFATVFSFIAIAVWLAMIGVFITLIILAIKALRKYINSAGPGAESARVRKSLGEAIRERRSQLGMTQESVAESLGVSRQAVSKWENGLSDPSTANLLALSKLFGVSLDELLKDIR